MPETLRSIFVLFGIIAGIIGFGEAGAVVTEEADGSQVEFVTYPPNWTLPTETTPVTLPAEPVKPPTPVNVVHITAPATTTTTVPGFANANCPEVWDMAISVGWPTEWLPKLDRIVWEESRCTADVVSRTKDYGYTQINWAAHGSRLTEKGISREMLLDPVVNLTEALWIAEYARDNYGCWSQPWYMSGDWC
jgi:hypothetical protein